MGTISAGSVRGIYILYCFKRDRPMHRGKAESAFGLNEIDKVSYNRNG